MIKKQVIIVDLQCSPEILVKVHAQIVHVLVEQSVRASYFKYDTQSGVKPYSGHIFHGGCDGCKQWLSKCPECCYFNSNWDLPDFNKGPVKVPWTQRILNLFK